MEEIVTVEAGLAALDKSCERFSAEEKELLEKAKEFAINAHSKQLRQSGDPYITHPLAVATMLADMGMDSNTVIAGLLHDTVEDGENITVASVKNLFGTDIAQMVDGVTKLTKSGNTNLYSKEEAQAENLRKMFLATAKDVRVVIIKLADRLHNMRTLQYCNEEKRIRKSRETLNVYAPLAHRFGMGAIKCELEDLSFKYIWPDDYQNLNKQIGAQQRERMATLDNAMKEISKALQAANIEAQVHGRPKHLFSIYKKLIRQNKSIEEIYDLIAVRVLVNTVSDCYAALGVIHSLWKPVPGRFKDYIAMPKVNMYRSIHTTLFSGEGMPFEVQIRTYEMHRASEYGIAAHWMYKEGRASMDDLDSKLAWLREALEMENYADTTKEFVDSIQKDFFSDYVYVLTPNGEIIDLPIGSTPLDFAYRIHTNVGNRTQHVKVNGALVRLDYKLKNNDVVEIITSPNATPSRDWLNIAKTQQAKAKIRQWFKKANREENIMRGKDMLADAAKRHGYALSELTKVEYFSEVLKRLNMADSDDVYAAIGYGGVTTGQVIHKLMELKKHDENQDELSQHLEQLQKDEAKPQHSSGDRGVIVKGEPNLMVRFSHCCSPLPGDDIVGYITRGRGVSIHRRDCTNMSDLMIDADRIIEVSWASNEKSTYTASIQAVATERPGILMEISQLLMSLNISIKAMNAKTDKNGLVTLQFTFDVSGAEQMNNIIKNIRKIKSVKEAYRINI